MPRSISTSRKFSILSAVLSFVSIILGIVSFGLPYWIYFDDVIIVSISGTTNNVQMKFHYGFWSYCNDVSTSTQTLNSCGPIKTHSDQEQLTICLVMLSIILSVNAFVNTCLFLLLLKNEKLCLYVTAASALLSGLLSAGADINYGIQDHTAKISASYTLPFSLSNLSTAFWLSIVNCIIISMSAVFTVVALYFHCNKDIHNFLQTDSPRESIYQYEKEVPKDTISAASQDVYDQTLYKSPGCGVFNEYSSEDEDSKRPLCVNSQDRNGTLSTNEGSLRKGRRMEEPSLEIDDYTKQAEGYVSGVWSELEKNNAMSESSDTESLTPHVDNKNASHRSHCTPNSRDGSVMKAVPAGSQPGSFSGNDVRLPSSVSGLINRSPSFHSTSSLGERNIPYFEDNNSVSYMTGNYEVFLLPHNQPKTEYKPDENDKGYFIPDDHMTTFKSSSSPKYSTDMALNRKSRPNTAENSVSSRMENTSYTTLQRPKSKTSSRQERVYMDQKTSDASPNVTRTLTPVSINATRIPNEEMSPDLPTKDNELDSLACSRPSLRNYPDAFSLISKTGHPPLDTRIQSDTNGGRTMGSDEQILTTKDRVSLVGSVESHPDLESRRKNIESLNDATSNPASLNGSAKGVAMEKTPRKKNEIDIAGAISNNDNEISEHTDTASNAIQDGDIADLSKVTIATDTSQKSKMRKKISIQFNVAQPILSDETLTRSKVKHVRKMPFGRNQKPNSTTTTQPIAPRRPPTAKSLKKQPSLVLDEKNPYSRPGTAVKLDESRPFKESNEIKVIPKKELVKKAAYKRLKQSYQCRLPRMYNTEKQEIFRKLAKIHTESTVKKQDPSKVAVTTSSGIRPRTSKRRLSPSPPRIKLKQTEDYTSEKEACPKEDGVFVSNA